MRKLITAILLAAAPGVPIAAQTVGGAASVDPTPPVAPNPPFSVPVRIVPTTPLPVATTAQPLVCKTTLVTGSLIARRKQCLTKAQWRYVDDVNQQFVHKLQEDNSGKSAGFGGGPN